MGEGAVARVNCEGEGLSFRVTCVIDQSAGKIDQLNFRFTLSRV